MENSVSSPTNEERSVVASFSAYVSDLARQDLVRVAIAGAIFAAGSGVFYAAWGSISIFAKVMILL